MPDEYVDISVPLAPDMLTWPTDPQVELTPVTGEQLGLQVTVTHLRLGSHTGTHVDAPRHFRPGGTAVDQLPFTALIGPAQVLDLRGVERIGAAELGDVTAARLLLKTDNSRWIRGGPIPARPAYLSADGARWLVERGVLLVGIDGLTVDGPDAAIAHEVLLGAGIVVLETTDLSLAEAGEYELICLPLRIAGGDGAPARAVLRRVGFLYSG
jgi:arylformamidase